MRIIKVEDLHCNAGWRDFSFLKISTDEGLVGWSEYMEWYGSQGLSAVIRRLSERLIGQDPRPVERHTAFLHGVTRAAPGGMNQQAIAAIENALVDLKAKALGIPVYELLGGPIRDRLRLYWSHCGSYQVMFGEQFREWTGSPPIRSLNDVVAQGAEVARRGFKGLKTNIMRFDGDRPGLHMPGFNAPFAPDLPVDAGLVQGMVEQMAAFRQGAGRGCGAASRSEFQLPDRGIYPRRAGDGAVRADLAGGGFAMTRRRWRRSGAALARGSHRASRCSGVGSTGRFSSSSRWMWRSSTCRGTVSWSR